MLAESAFHLQSVPLVLAMIGEGFVTLAFDCRDHLSQLAILADRYADRHPDLADLYLIRMRELHPGHSVITVEARAELTAAAELYRAMDMTFWVTRVDAVLGGVAG